MTSTQKKKRVKKEAYAVLMNHYKHGWLPIKIAYYSGKEICEAEIKKLREWNNTSELKVVPCTITYSLPLQDR